MGSVVSMGSKTSLRVAPKKTPTEATVPATDTLKRRLARPIVNVSGVEREQAGGGRREEEKVGKCRRAGAAGRHGDSAPSPIGFHPFSMRYLGARISHGHSLDFSSVHVDTDPCIYIALEGLVAKVCVVDQSDGADTYIRNTTDST